MSSVSQTSPRLARARVLLPVLALLCLIPPMAEAWALLWGIRHQLLGKALRDGLDFWAGGTLALQHQVMTVFQPDAYRQFLAAEFGALPSHFWSYPPSYLLLCSGFGWLPPVPAVIAFDLLTLLLLVLALRVARQSWALVLAVACSPAALENLLEGQNAALMTALLGGGLLCLGRRPRLAGVLIGLATCKPQLGLPLPAFLLRRSRAALACAMLAALGLFVASCLAFGPAVWARFWQITRPAMDNVLLTGRPPEFAGGLISVFAAMRGLGVPSALAAQAAVSLLCAGFGLRVKSPAALLILCALASPYLHDYDLLGVTLATALLVEDRLRHGFRPGETLLFFVAWEGPGALPWAPQLAHLTPAVLLLLLASALRRDRFAACESRTLPSPLPASSAGR